MSVKFRKILYGPSESVEQAINKIRGKLPILSRTQCLSYLVELGLKSLEKEGGDKEGEAPSPLYASSEKKPIERDTGGVGGEIVDFCLKSEDQTANGNGSEGKKKRQKLPMLMWEDIHALKKNPGYKGIDVEREAYKFKEWCQHKQRAGTLNRFLSWLNRV